MSIRPVTLKDVAERAGVNKATASAILSGKHPHVRVSEETRQRLIEAVQEMGYRPNAVARSLRTHSTNILGLYCDRDIGWPTVRHPFFGKLIDGCEAACNTFNKDLLLSGLARERPIEETFSGLTDGRLDGLILFARASAVLPEMLASASLPVVAVVETLAAIPCVVVDDAGGAQRMLDYILHKRIQRIIVRCALTPSPSVTRRYRAFLASAAHNNVVCEEWQDGSGIGLSQEIISHFLDHTTFSGSAVIVLWQDADAYALLTALRVRGIRVPEQVAVTGFDDFPELGVGLPRLTTIHAPWDKVSNTAVALLMDKIAGKEIPAETVIPVHLIVADTL